jgi:HD-GYP domain-containing protein (c-di-GMP phosphodiesterase class II)
MPSVGRDRGVVGQSNDIRRSASLPVQTLVDQEVFGNESEETRQSQALKSIRSDRERSKSWQENQFSLEKQEQQFQQIVEYLKGHPDVAKKAIDYIRAHPDDVKAAVKEVAEQRGWDRSKIDMAALKTELGKIVTK